MWQDLQHVKEGGDCRVVVGGPWTKYPQHVASLSSIGTLRLKCLLSRKNIQNTILRWTLVETDFKGIGSGEIYV